MTARALSIRVYYDDTDSGGVMYHANYLAFAERARTEFLRESGITLPALAAETGAGFAVRRCTVDYHRPARLDDLLTVRTAITTIGGASINMDQKIFRDAMLLTSLDVKLACLDSEGRPMRIPRAVRAALSPEPEKLESV